MSSTTIRLQLEKKELVNAQRLAETWGFASVEETLHALISRFLKKADVTEPIMLSDKAKERYRQINADFKNEKNMHVAKDIDEFLAQLNA